MHAT
jgi:hypothetical protein